MECNDARQAAGDDKEEKTNSVQDRGDANNNVNDDDIWLIGEAKTAMQKVLDMNVKMRGNSGMLSLEKRVAMLNVDQGRPLFDKVKSHLLHQHKHKEGQCTFAATSHACESCGRYGKIFPD